MSSLRLLPWSGEGGKPAYLSTDGEGSSYLSRLADNLEAVQLGMAGNLLDYVDKALADGELSETELRSMLARMGEALRDALRVAESRGHRLPASDDGDGGVASSAADAVIEREIAR